MNLTDAAAAINVATAIMSESNEEARLVERVRQTEEVCKEQSAATHTSREIHRANYAHIDALAALDAFRNKRRDEAGVTAWEMPT
ncbi:MAG: hypothetical protein M0Z99_32125 [Betaproteobacteria bacterium]|nr:hypothetical protein [Betaproteobacteria bacterium]